MGGRRGRGNTKNLNKTQENSTLEEIEQNQMEHEGDATGKMDQAKTLREGLASIGKDMRELKQQFHNELKTFKDELKSEIKNEIKQEIAYLRQDIDHKLTGKQ